MTGGAEAALIPNAEAEAGAEAALRASEQRFRAFFDAMGESVALCELVRGLDGRATSWRYLEVNPAFEAQSQLPRAHFEGKLRTEIGIASDGQLLPMFESVVDRGETIRFEYVSAHGRCYAVTAFACGVNRFAVISDFISANQRADVAARESAARQTFLLALSDAVRPLVDPVAIQDAAANLLAAHLGVARCYYAEFDEDMGALTIHREFVRAGLPSMCGVYPVSEVGRILEILRSGRRFMTRDWLAEPDPPRRAGDAAYGMRAHLIIPLAKEGRMLGSLTVSDGVPRDWTPFEISLVEETAERTWAAVERAYVTTALKNREAQLAFLDEISQAMAVAAPEGEILNRISERIAAHLHLTHCSFLDVDTARGCVTTNFGWRANGPTKIVPRIYRISDYLTPDFERAGRGGETVVVCNTHTDPRTDAQAYARLEIIAFVAVPFHREGEWKFLMAVGDDRPREWRTGEVQLLRQLSERIFPRIERARAEAALRESEALYHSLFEMMDEGFAVGEIVRDATGRAVDYKLLEINRAYEQQTGRSRATELGRPMSELAPDMNPMWLREFARVVDTGQPTRFEQFIARLDCWFDVRAFARGGD